MALFGSSQKPLQIQQVPTRSPQQMMGQNQLLQMGLSGLQNLPQADFGPIAQQVRTQFQTQTVPGLAERFTSMGAGGGRSSAFTGALGQAGAGLEEALAALQSQFGLQQRGQEQNFLQSLLGFGLQPQFENIAQQKGPGFGTALGGGLGALLPLLPMLLGGAFGGPAGAAGGAGLSQLLSSLFGGR